MAGPSRRTFVGWIGALGALIGLRRTTFAAPATADTQGTPLPPLLLLALVEAVLPSELGSDGVARAEREFSGWVTGYRTGAELLHPYGSDEIGFAPRLPLAVWRSQLVALDAESKRRHRLEFPALGVAERQAMVREGLAGITGNSLPPIGQAGHIALAVLAHYYDSPGATDLCYGVQLARNQCRPLVHNSRQPLPLAGGRA